MPARLTDDTSLSQAKNFVSSFSSNSYYFFFGRAQNWDDEETPPTPTNSIVDEAQTHAQMIGLNKIESSNVCHVIERVDWVSGQYYDMYRDDYDGTVPGYSSSGSQTFPSSLTNARCIVTVDAGSGVFNVYKCLDNRRQTSGDGVNGGTVVPSTIKPTSTTNEIIVTSDGYRWKYLTTVSELDKVSFFTPDWTPIREVESNVSTGGNGAIHALIIENQGSGYTSTPTITFDCDGTAPTVDSVTLVNGRLTHIKLSAYGTGNSFCNVTVSAPGGVGITATVKAVMSPFGGHGYSNINETYADRIIVTTSLASANGFNGVAYRQIGIIRDPLNFGTTVVGTANTLDPREKFEYVVADGDGSIVNGQPLKKDGTTEVIRYPAQFTEDDSDEAVQLISITNAGSGYTSAPTVVFTGGAGSGAAATAVISGGVVTVIRITNPGTGYTSAPSISFDGGGGSGAAATATIGPRTFVFLVTDYDKKHKPVVNQDVLSNIGETLKIRVMNKVNPSIVYRSGKILFEENRDVLIRTEDTLERFKMVLDF
jgi:hypothetical protein